ncbi:MAG: hypothetical protein NTX28_06330 [Novosphingobium sp.]|nr:hypothetical protein [Novosphingobium sp.]
MFDASTSTEITICQPATEESQALRIFDHLPGGFVAMTLEDRSLHPLVRPGETIVADISDRKVYVGGIYLRRFVSCDGRARLYVDELFSQPQRQFCEDSQSWYTADAYYFVKHNWPKNAQDWPEWAKHNGNVFQMADGPFYPSSDGKYWRDQIGTVVGRVVGVLKPGTAEVRASS